MEYKNDEMSSLYPHPEKHRYNGSLVSEPYSYPIFSVTALVCESLAYAYGLTLARENMRAFGCDESGISKICELACQCFFRKMIEDFPHSQNRINIALRSRRGVFLIKLKEEIRNIISEKNLKHVQRIYCQVEICSEFQSTDSPQFCELHAKNTYHCKSFLANYPKPQICMRCGTWFKSRNSLFIHLRQYCLAYVKWGLQDVKNERS
jgi:hypothetical protein